MDWTHSAQVKELEATQEALVRAKTQKRLLLIAFIAANQETFITLHLILT